MDKNMAFYDQLVGVTPEHSFMFMLLERVNQLEDGQDKHEEMFALVKKEIPNCIPYEWYIFRFTVALPTSLEIPMNEEEHEHETHGPPVDEYYLMQIRDQCINRVFKHRNITNPQFGYWSWRITSTNVYELLVYVRFHVPIAKKDFELDTWRADLLPEIQYQMHPVYSGASDMKMIIKERLGYIDSFPYAVPDYGVELWRKGGDEVNHPLDETWTSGPFIDSSNYKKGVHEFFLLRDHLLRLIRMKRWIELFRIGEYE